MNLLICRPLLLSGKRTLVCQYTYKSERERMRFSKEKMARERFKTNPLNV